MEGGQSSAKVDKVQRLIYDFNGGDWLKWMSENDRKFEAIYGVSSISHPHHDVESTIASHNSA